MKKFLIRALFFLIPFLWSIYVCSQPKMDRDCGTTCFSSEVIASEKVSATCTSYEIKVSFSGTCAHALSHYTVSVPCGTISNLWNSQNWKQEIGIDPTSGLSGFKIDGIENFGEGSLASFHVKFTLCADETTCASQLDCWQPQVAYKAATCVNIETLAATCRELKASLSGQDASCPGVADGSLAVIIEEGTAPYTFLWSNGEDTQTIEELPAGTYSVVVTDASGKELMLEGIIAEPPAIDVSGTATAASCNGMADGAIDLTVSGGAAPYSFLWASGATTEDISGVSAGHYSVSITDSNGCSANAEFQIKSNSSLAIAASQLKPDCNDTNGAIDITLSGGTAPYTFEWSNGVITEDIADIGAGVYTVKVTDTNGCTQERSFFLRENNTLAVTGFTTPSSCNDDASGTVDITITGGTQPYTYLWSNGETTEDLDGLQSGYYTVTVKDAKGCSATGGYVVSKSTFQVPRTVVQPTCAGANDGSITLQEPVGGTGPFTYEWSNGETGTSISDLAAGTYSVTVTDATGCTRTVTSTISDPSAIAVSAEVTNTACNENGAFAIDLSVSGGTAPYSYQWSSGSNEEDLSGLDAGNYTVNITDAHGCSISEEIAVAGEPVEWTCLIDQPGAVPACNSVNNIISSAITDADSYSWSVSSIDGSWVLTNSDSQSAGYTAGNAGTTATFTLTVTKGGCTQTCSYTTSTCTGGSDPGPGGEDPGGEDPGGEEPGEGEEPGGENPGGNGDQSCDECFTSSAKVTSLSATCRMYELQVETTGLCKYDLSHWTIALRCGAVSNTWNSRGWRMEIGKDPTTGLYGLKVDNIDAFGKEPESFTVGFTLCETSDCDLNDWEPIVAYKAGLCVATETIDIGQTPAGASSISVYPNPFTDAINFGWEEPGATAALEIIDQYGNPVSRSTTTDPAGHMTLIRWETSDLPKGMYYYRLTVDGRIFNGKISKR